MGRLLQIRVMAQTFRPADVERAWPKLCRLAWPEAFPDKGAPGGPPLAERGVLELTQALADRVSFGGLDKALVRQIEPRVQAAYGLMEDLHAALADWKPGAANAASDRLEDALSELEKDLPKD